MTPIRSHGPLPGSRPGHRGLVAGNARRLSGRAVHERHAERRLLPTTGRWWRRLLPRGRLPRRRPTVVTALIGPVVATVIARVEVAVVVIVTASPLPVVAPPRLPLIAGAPVIRRRKVRLGLRGAVGQSETGRAKTSR